jgi:SAM-dependent methyltransferase
MELRTVFRRFRTLSKSYRRSKSTWDAGIGHEVSFWDAFLKTQGFDAWKDDYRKKVDPEAPLADYLCALMDHLPDDPLRILDVGAGPLTTLGKTHPTKRLEITATDPLATQYDALLKAYQIEPPVRTIPVAAESLIARFARNTFHLATAYNCLDHSYDPVDAIRQMVALVKPTCHVYLCHVENEGQNQKYEGLHQWNFTIEDGDFIIRNADASTNMTKVLGSKAAVRAFRDDGTIWGSPSSTIWVHVSIRKLAA